MTSVPNTGLFDVSKDVDLTLKLGETAMVSLKGTLQMVPVTSWKPTNFNVQFTGQLQLLPQLLSALSSLAEKTQSLPS